MKNQREITEEIGRVQLEIEQVNDNRHTSNDIDADVSKHKCLLAYRNALVWVIDMKEPMVDQVGG